MRRQIVYRWLLREVMAEHGMFTTTALSPLLAERGIDLSPSQVHRLVTTTPERLSLPVLAALCDIFQCTPAELVATSAHTVAERKAAGAPAGPNVVDLATTGRPKRARLRPDKT